MAGCPHPNPASCIQNNSHLRLIKKFKRYGVG